MALEEPRGIAQLSSMLMFFALIPRIILLIAISMSTYVMTLSIKALKIYINKNSLN